MSGDTVKFVYDDVQDIYVTVDSLPNRLLDGRSHMVPTYSYNSAPSWDQKTDTIQGDYRDTGCRLSSDFRPHRLFAKRDRLYGITPSGKIFRSKVTAVPSAVRVRTHYTKVHRLSFIESVALTTTQSLAGHFEWKDRLGNEVAIKKLDELPSEIDLTFLEREFCGSGCKRDTTGMIWSHEIWWVKRLRKNRKYEVQYASYSHPPEGILSMAGQSIWVFWTERNDKGELVITRWELKSWGG